MNQAILDWCEENDPNKESNRQNLIKQLKKQSNFTIGANGLNCLLNNEEWKPAICTAVVCGMNNREAALKTLMQGYSLPFPSNYEFEQVLQEFESAPLTGCTTVLDMARIASGFNPNTLQNGISFEQSSYVFSHFLNRVLEAPFFTLANAQTVTLERNSNNWSDAINELVNLCYSFSNKAPLSLREQMIYLAKTAASNEVTANRTSLFTINALEANPDFINVYFFTAYISMRKINGGRKTADSVQSTIKLNSTVLSFDVKHWKEYARIILKKHIKLVDEWLEENTTRLGQNQVHLCIEHQF